MAKSWQNWLGNQRAQVRHIEPAATTGQVVDALERASKRRERVRVLAGGSAWSPLVPVDGTLLAIGELKAVRHIDLPRKRITVETGMMLRDAVDIAARNGMSLESPAMFLGLTIGGLIATGSHGTGRHCATLGDAVVGFELVTADGKVIEITEPGSQLWRAVIASVGVLGVVTAVTLQCEPLYNVHEIHEQVPAADVATLLPVATREFEFVSAFWHPGAKMAVLKLGNRTQLPAAPLAGRIEPKFFERMAGWAGPLIPRLYQKTKAVTPLVAQAMAAGIGRGSRVIREPMFSHYQQVYPPCISSEFAVPMEATERAWRWVYDRLSAYDKAGVRPVNLVVHCRFGRASQALVASSSGRASCHLECLSFAGNAQRDLFSGEFDQTMRQQFAGRPHWGKDIANPFALAATHGSALDEFLAVRAELDPDQRLLNPWLRDEVFALGRRKTVAVAAQPQPAAPTAKRKAGRGEIAVG